MFLTLYPRTPVRLEEIPGISDQKECGEACKSTDVDEGFLGDCNMRTQRSGMMHGASTGSKVLSDTHPPGLLYSYACGGLSGMKVYGLLEYP